MNCGGGGSCGTCIVEVSYFVFLFSVNISCKLKDLSAYQIYSLLYFIS